MSATTGFLIGWTFGALGMWVYFHQAGLIRTREEWERGRGGDR